MMDFVCFGVVLRSFLDLCMGFFRLLGGSDVC